MWPRRWEVRGAAVSRWVTEVGVRAVRQDLTGARHQSASGTRFVRRARRGGTRQVSLRPRSTALRRSPSSAKASPPTGFRATASASKPSSPPSTWTSSPASARSFRGVPSPRPAPPRRGGRDRPHQRGRDRRTAPEARRDRRPVTLAFHSDAAEQILAGRTARGRESRGRSNRLAVDAPPLPPPHLGVRPPSVPGGGYGAWVPRPGIGFSIGPIRSMHVLSKAVRPSERLSVNSRYSTTRLQSRFLKTA